MRTFRAFCSLLVLMTAGTGGPESPLPYGVSVCPIAAPEGSPSVPRP